MLDGVEERLAEVRMSARRKVRDRLAMVAGLATGDRRERDALLRRIAAWDDPADTGRGLAGLVGLSHTAVQKILKQATEERDTALDHLDVTVESLRRAWDPPPIPPAREDDLGDDEQRDDWEIEADDRDQHQRRAWHLRQKMCAACGKPSRRIVRWQVGKTSIAADADDPHRSGTGYVRDLSQPPALDGQPTWTVCGTVCARQVIDNDRANPSGATRVAGNDEFFYAVEAFHYLPHDSELPDVLVRLRATLMLTDHSRAVTTGDTAGAALHLRSLRRDIARTAAVLASIDTYTPPPRVFRPGDPEPSKDDVLQVRHGDTIYSNWSVLHRDRDDHWEDTNHTRRHTWDELTALGEITEIPPGTRPYPHRLPGRLDVPAAETVRMAT